MRAIPLTQGLYAIVDNRDYARLSRFKWRAQRTDRKDRWYAVRRTSRKRGPRRHVWMHRVICVSRFEIDHINGNGLDNRRRNLRAATPVQNKANTRKHLTYRGMPTSSRYKGVSWKKDKSRWKAEIMSKGKATFLGYFSSETAAARAYDAAARKLSGRFARCNFAVRV